MEDLVLSCLESRVEDNRTLYSRFLIGPFFKGDALTVATALRRVLLSSVESVAITALYIQGITHEFSTIVGVRESVLELSLNFQSIVLSYDKNFFQRKNLFEDFQIGYLQVQGPKVVYANDLKLPLGIKVVYPTQYIATVSREGVIVLKFTIGKMDNRLASSVSSHASETDSRKQIIHHPVFGELVKKNIARTKKRYSYKSIYAINTLANAPRVQSGALYEPHTLHFGVRTKARTKLCFVKPSRTKLRFIRRCKQSGALQRTWHCVALHTKLRFVRRRIPKPRSLQTSGPPSGMRPLGMRRRRKATQRLYKPRLCTFGASKPQVPLRGCALWECAESAKQRKERGEGGVKLCTQRGPEVMHLLRQVQRTCKQSSALQRTCRALYWLYLASKGRIPYKSKICSGAELCTSTNRRFVCKERAFVRISKKKTNFNFSTIKRATPFFALHTKRLLIRFGENRRGDDRTNSLSEVDKNFYKANTNPACTGSRSLQTSTVYQRCKEMQRTWQRGSRVAVANLRSPFGNAPKAQSNAKNVAKGEIRFAKNVVGTNVPFLAPLVHSRGAKGKRSRPKCVFVTRFSMRKRNVEKAGASLVDYVTRTANQKALALAFVRAAKVNFTRQAHRVNIKNASFRARNDRSLTKLRFVSDALVTEASTKTFIPICCKGAFPFVPLIQSKNSVLTKAQQVKTSYKSKFWKIKSSKALIYRSFSLPANTSCKAPLCNDKFVASQTGTLCVGKVCKVPTLLPVAPPVQRNAPKVQRKERAFVRALFLNQRSIAYKAPLCKRCINKSKQIQSSYKTKTDTSIFNVLCKKYISKHRLQDQEEFFNCKEMQRWRTIDRCFYKSRAPFKTSICTHHLSLNRVVGMQKQLLFAKRLNNLSFFKVKYSSLVKRGVRRVDKVFKSDICLRNIIPLDFTLPPVLRVNFVIEIDDEVLYLRQKVRERIILEVWTNGSIHPRQAVHDATLSLLDMFSSFRSLYQIKSYSPPQLKLPGYSKNLKSLYRHLR